MPLLVNIHHDTRREHLRLLVAYVVVGTAGGLGVAAWAALRGTPQVRSVTVGSPSFDRLVQALYRRDLVLFGPL